MQSPNNGDSHQKEIGAMVLESTQTRRKGHYGMAQRVAAIVLALALTAPALAQCPNCQPQQQQPQQIVWVYQRVGLFGWRRAWRPRPIVMPQQPIGYVR